FTLIVLVTFSVILLSSSALFIHQSNKASCQVLDVIVGNLKGPISRELALGEDAIASNILNKISYSLDKLGATSVVYLKRYPGNNPTNGCYPSVFLSKFVYRLNFAGTPVGFISGNI